MLVEGLAAQAEHADRLAAHFDRERAALNLGRPSVAIDPEVVVRCGLLAARCERKGWS